MRRNDYTRNTSLNSPEGMTSRFTQALEYINPDEKVLDIGCGVGTFTELVKRTYPSCEVWGVDISDQAISDNRRLGNGVEYYQGYVGRLDNIPEAYFNVVFSGEVLEHLEDPSLLVRDAYNKLDEGGVFILTTPLEDRIKSPEHTWYFTKEDVEKLLLDTGFVKPYFITLPNIEGQLVIFVIGYKQ